MQILDGLILDPWRFKCGFPSLAAFAKSGPSPEDLLSIAEKILLDHATLISPPLNEKSQLSNPARDKTHPNTCLLIHDLLYVTKVTHVISDGDWGHIEDILANLAMIFYGAGSKNYCTEILHFLHNLKYV